mmetsp:Transcript_12695/g.23026  ORF Transcript_12695/g.23026 Transcript_12695/m.23026 type:complete len:290 (-) Transcript_12695:172-1041(-)|eukprot:CAMPEP_0197524428 /NCGR_PEP_ID=MMETSP1318-20131121/9111_1 /TAXON_ID=552666 /ORGANISM="Partenskyella glossopodia, Strain RCC365" /LENGTH=289 /DNA_ID=CAMNT_0043077385 /DNA_START=109 /DNA_END=978 /DNA_ORIENTATION=+
MSATERKSERKSLGSDNEGGESYRLYGHEGPYKNCMGVFHEHFRETQGNSLLRSVYRHEFLPVYLYFHIKDSTWALSNVIGSSKCWMYTPDTAAKPHLIISPWKYIDPATKSWSTETGLKCEPTILEDGSQSRRESLRVQMRAMQSVIVAMKKENALLKEKVRAKWGDDNEMDALRKRRQVLKDEVSRLVMRISELKKTKKQCTNLKRRKEMLEAQSRQILQDLTQKEKDIKTLGLLDQQHATHNKANGAGLDIDPPPAQLAPLPDVEEADDDDDMPSGVAPPLAPYEV